MKITERKLKRLIGKVINEMIESSDVSNFMKKAIACRDMSADMLFNMCAQLCAKNHLNRIHCLKLCACVLNKDMKGCCSCLKEICKCGDCAEICYRCCGC